MVFGFIFILFLVFGLASYAIGRTVERRHITKLMKVAAMGDLTLTIEGEVFAVEDMNKKKRR